MRFVEVVKHYPGQQQVNLSVEIEVPGNWFGGTEMGSLNASERRQKYKAQAVEYVEVREFPGATARARKVKAPAIRFICLDDASSDPNSDGYWMQLSQWNRFRHDTFKERPDDEMPFILGTGTPSALAAELDSGGAQIADGTCKSRVLSTCTMNVTRWQGLYRMVNKNRRLAQKLAVALTGTEGGDEPMDEELEEVGDEEEEQEQEEEHQYDSDTDDDEQLLEADSDEEQVQANEVANKQFPLAHRLLDDTGFKNNSLLESVLHSCNQVSGLVQKQDGMGLSMGFQMAKVLKDEVTSMKLMVVSGTSKDGDWKEIHAGTLPPMFKKQRSVLAEQLEMRFKIDGTPDNNTLLALKMDPSVNTSAEDGIFSKRTATQQLMMGEYRRRLVRRHKLMCTVADRVAGSSHGNSAGAAAKRKAPSTGGVVKKGPASVLARISHLNSEKQVVMPVMNAENTDKSLEVVKLEEAKYASICVSVYANTEQFMDAGIFDLGLFWSQQKSILPVHYSLWMAEVGCAKVASANVEVVFSGAGRISQKSRCLDPQLLSDYSFLHYNYKYDWLRPTLEEIVAAYMKLYGKESRDSDDESSGTEGSEGTEEEVGEEEGEEGDEKD